jgi:D-xylose 1-dehydrogenase (NADP+, D-xylono-1,5-lactone-forming)
MGDDVVRWGILSTAHIARIAVCPAIRSAKNGSLAAVASRDEAKASTFAAETGIPRSWGSYDALLDDDGIDAVYIPLPNNLHREWTIKALRAGKHVLCEKPLALSASECEEMDACAQEAGLVAMEAFMYRFHPRTIRVVELVRDGVIGPPRTITSTFTFRLTNPTNIRWDAALGGGSLMDVGCYCINVSRTLAGSEPVEVQAMANWTSTGVDEQMVGALRFAGGLLASFDCALNLERRESFAVVGPEGHLEVAAAFVPGTDQTTIEEIHGRQGRTSHVIRGANEYQHMVEHFGECVRDGTAVRYPLSEAAANMRVIEALYRSARNGGIPERV